MDDQQALHHQQQLEQQEQEEITIEHFDKIAYRCLGVAQAMKDCRQIGNVNQLLLAEKRLIELATEYDQLKKRYWTQK